MKIGLVGFKSSGKTTVFNALTGQRADVGGYGTPGKVNLGVIKVPDERVDALAEICKPKKVTFAEVTFADVPGFEAGKGLEAAALTQLRDQDAFAHVVAAFAGADPVKAMRDLEVELVLADMGVVEKRLERLKKEKGKPGEKELLDKLAAALSDGRPLRALPLSRDEEKALSSFDFLSRRPVLHVLNVEETSAGKPAPAEVAEAAAGAPVVVLCGRAEMDIAELEPEEQTAFLADLGLSEPARTRFIRACYGLLDLISMFTVGEDEVKAWTIHRGEVARRAAGKIHTDIERGFIRAEVIRYEDYVHYRSEARCRETGKLRLEGKEYVVQDGDVVHFRFNV